jgi:hypothetical protein
MPVPVRARPRVLLGPSSLDGGLFFCGVLGLGEFCQDRIYFGDDGRMAAEVVGNGVCV